ncbi:pimeloyl-ACP methyl ester esterase BioH [Candidatus Halobeggiatoa sp. HSG11]|nr:pimeloyl-ACP methyl ester esterase BioH [Candidatus Halobeggiatoa sp. HSG11]
MFIKQQGQGKPLILLHGWGFNGNIWNEIAADLAKNWQVYQVDLPGHGKSPMCEYSLPILTEQLAANLPNNAIWIGWSLGGLLAMNIAIQCQVRGLILVATSPRFVTAKDWPCAMTAELLQQFADQLQTDTVETLRRFLTLQVRGCDNAREQLRNLNFFLTNPPQTDALQSGLQLLQHTDLRSLLQQINCPALLCLGKRDKIVPVEVGEKCQTYWPELHKTIIKPAAHIPFLSHPELFMEILQNFLAQIST